MWEILVHRWCEDCGAPWLDKIKAGSKCTMEDRRKEGKAYFSFKVYESASLLARGNSCRS